MTSLALTKKAVNILYGPTEGSDQVILKTDDTVSIDIDDDAVLYLWHRMLSVIGSPNGALSIRDCIATVSAHWFLRLPRLALLHTCILRL